MKAFASFLTKFDRNPAAPTLTYGGIQSKQNIVGGLIGLSFIILAATMIISKCIRLLNKQDILVESFVRRDFQEVRVESQNIILFYAYQKGNQTIYISYKDLPLYGVQSIMVKIEFDMERQTQPQKFNVEPCSTNSTIDYFLCVRGYSLLPKCNVKMAGGQGCNAIVQYHYITRPCNSSNILCQPFRQGIYVKMILLSNFFDVSKKNWSDVIHENIVGVNPEQMYHPFKQDSRKLFSVAVSKVQIQSDESILPAILRNEDDVKFVESYFFPIQYLGLVEEENSLNVYADFVVYRSGFTQIYKRSLPRIDNILGQIFGLIGLLSLFSLLLCSWVNNWLLQKHLRRSLSPEIQKDLSLKSFVQNKIPFIPKDQDRAEELKEIDIIELYKTVQILKQKVQKYETSKGYQPPQDIET